MSNKEFESLKEVLSENIKTLRQQHNLAQERLGLEAGVDRTLISKIERRIGNPSLLILLKIANQLQVDVIDLLTEQKK